MSLGEYAALDTRLAAIGGISARLFSSHRGFGHGLVYTQPVPVDLVQFIKPLDSCLPQFQEVSCIHPLLKPIVRGRMRT